MGRPAVNTVLNNTFKAPSAATGTAKDAYNADADPSTWVATNKDEFKKNLAILDSLDTGFCGNGLCEALETAISCALDCNANGTLTTACGNHVLYNGGVGTTPSATSYEVLASILADDELYLDTSKTKCAFYLAVEFGFATAGPGTNTTCGGRAPSYDVIDYSLSVLAIGIAGFSTDGNFTPDLGDGTPPHDDYLSTFPYLGEPHTP